jgi:hypothetical protein
VEQTPGDYANAPEVDEAIRSLVENGVTVEIEVQYSNPLYQGDPASRPKRVTLPPVGIGGNDNPPNPIFVPPTTDGQIEAFLKYTRFMVAHFRDRVKYWEFWNEPNVGYWQPTPDILYGTEKEQHVAKARQYGRLLARFADAVHETDPEAKVMSAGTAGSDLLFVRAALADCASKTPTTLIRALAKITCPTKPTPSTRPRSSASSFCTCQGCATTSNSG